MVYISLMSRWLLTLDIEVVTVPHGTLKEDTD